MKFCFRITEIHRGAINNTIANTIVTDNEIGTFYSGAFVIQRWDRVTFDNNIMHHVEPHFLELRDPAALPSTLTFVGNEIYKTDDDALRFVADLRKTDANLKFEGNFFNQTCFCDISRWIMGLLGDQDMDTAFVLDSSFCAVNALLSRCFEIPEGLINMRNYTELACSPEDVIACEKYIGETKVLNTTTDLLAEEKPDNLTLITGILAASMLAIILSGIVVAVLIRGGLWSKQKGYCMRFRNLQYHNESQFTIAEEEMETSTEHLDDSDKIDVPEELTPEILQQLREKLEDPETHEEAREMIERLYEMFIVGETYTNNNRRDEETHLYEELGNMKTPKPAEAVEDEPLGFLRLIEEKYNLPKQPTTSSQPALAGDYSEPSDAAVHLYSELQQNNKSPEEEKTKSLLSLNGTSSTLKSNSSGKMAFRPLPDKPKPYPDNSAPGPSHQH